MLIILRIYCIVFDHQEYYRQLQGFLESGKSVWQAIITDTDGSTPARAGMHLAVPETGNPFGNIGGGNLEHRVIDMIRSERPERAILWKFDLDEEGMPLDDDTIATAMICGGRVEILIEPLFSSSRLFIIGGGHCGKALAHLAHLASFQVTVIDNRKEILRTEDFPVPCKLIYSDYNDLETVIDFDSRSYIVIMTHGHVHDKQVLEYCLKRRSFYLGMIGSKKKTADTFTRLLQQGFSEEELARVHSPVGLSIGSQTPYEIAVSITAEMIRTRNLKK